MMNQILTIVSFILVFSSSGFGQSFRTDSGYVAFNATVPFHSFTGTSQRLSGIINLQDSVLMFYVDLNTLRTGIGKRDEKMREKLDTENYPRAKFHGTFAGPINTSISHPKTVTVTGTFTVHGISKKIEITGSMQKQSGGLRVKATWSLNLNDFDIDPPGILFYKVDEEQKIVIDALLLPVPK